MKKYFCISLIIFSLSGSAQNINQIKETDIPGINIFPGNSFAGKDLNDYLGNDADLYLEYGLKKIFVNEYTLNKDKAILKVYIMGNAPSAFGIYSMSIYQCIQWNLFGSFSCITPYHVAAVSGTLFIYASNKTGTQSGQALCEQLVKLVINNNPQEIWYAPALIQSAKAAPFTNTLRYYRGPLGLMKGLPSWSDIFENLNFHMFTMNINTPDYAGILARIIFPDESALSSFISKSNLDVMSDPVKPIQTSNGLYRSWYKINNTKILFMESNSPLANIMDFVPEVPDYKWLEEE
jgi:hypothetical protein